jgi:hypothetical protein
MHIAITHIAMTDAEIIRRFEDGEVAPSEFHHQDHVRLAFAYLCEYPALQALEKFSSALKNFAAAHGKTRLYHETITYAYLFLIRERIARTGAKGKDWEGFSRMNPDLLIWKNGILARYYDPATLDSELARNVFLFPDRLSANPR